MPPRRRSCFLLLVDHDTRRFNVIGPVADDSDWNARVVEAQRAGRRVNCSTSESQSEQDIVDSYTADYGYTYTRDPIM